jgi:hypothetical protein
MYNVLKFIFCKQVKLAIEIENVNRERILVFGRTPDDLPGPGGDLDGDIALLRRDAEHLSVVLP